MPSRFDHEKLNVYQRSLQFVVVVAGLLDRIPVKHSAPDQIERASTLIALNIAEGNGRYSPADRCRFFDMARGSALECAAVLDVLVARKILTEKEVETGKAILLEIVNMLVGLIRRNSESRLHEEEISCKV